MEENPKPTTNRNTRQSRGKKTSEMNEKAADQASRKKKTDVEDATTSKEVS